MTGSSRISSSHWGAFEAELVEGKLVGTRDFSRDAFPSPLIRSVPSAVYAGSRIRRPVVRRSFLEGKGRNELRGAEPFVPVSWDTALDLVAAELMRARKTRGNDTILGGSYGWASAGRINHARTLLQRFLNGFGGCVEQETNYSWGAAAILLPYVVGDYRAVAGPLTDWRSIVRETGLMVMFGGANPKNGRVTSGGAGSHEFRDWMSAASANGVRFVVISPTRADAPDFLAADWIPVRPNTDTALILALAFEIERLGLADQEFLGRYATGYERFRDYLRGLDDGVPKSPAWAAQITGVPAERIADLARRMAGNRTMISATWSLQRAEYGEQPYWAIVALAAMIGQIGLPGGGFGFGYGSINGMGTPRAAIPTPAMAEGHNPVRSAIPVARLTDLLLNPGETYRFNGETRVYPEIDLVYWAGGNPFHHQQDINKLLKAWHRPATIIVHEPWWTATARRADIVLPATTPFERNDIGSASRDRFLVAMRQLIEPLGEARNDFDIFASLAERLGFAAQFTEGRDISRWIRHAYEQTRRGAGDRGVTLPDFERFWQEGFVEIPAPEKEFVLFEEFRSDPGRFPLDTESGRIEIFSGRIASFDYPDCAGHPKWFEPREWLGSPAVERFPLHLLSAQPETRLHSQLDDASVSRDSKIAGREPIRINSLDAKARGISDGAIVRVFNGRGSCLAGASLTDDLVPGVVQLATGAWYDPVDPAEIGSMDKHGNPNVLTRDVGTSLLGQGSSAQSALVEVELWRGHAPAVTAYAPPAGDV